MQTYKFEPGACYTENGATYRPFLLNGKEIYKMSMSIMLGSDSNASNKEMVNLCEAIKEHTGVIISSGELPEAIKNRKLIKE